MRILQKIVTRSALRTLAMVSVGYALVAAALYLIGNMNTPDFVLLTALVTGVLVAIVLYLRHVVRLSWWYRVVLPFAVAALAARTCVLAWPTHFNEVAHSVTLWASVLPVLLALPWRTIAKIHTNLDRFLLPLDVLFMACAWMVAIWRSGMNGVEQTALNHGLWPEVFVFFVTYVVLSALTLTSWTKPNRAVYFWTLAVSLQTSCELMYLVLWHQGFGAQYNFINQYMLVALWLHAVGGMVVISAGYSIDVVERLGDRARANISTASAVVAIGIFFASLLGNPIVRPMMMVFSSALVVVFVVREFLRGRANQKLLHESSVLAYTDRLTGLGSRTFLGEELNKLAQNADSFGVVVLDVDRFSLVNEQGGHDAGDALLRGVAEELQKLCQVHDCAAFRSGGDEFTVLVPGSAEQAVTVAEAARSVIAQAAESIFPHMGLSASAGVAWAQVHGNIDDALVVGPHAAEALRMAKAEGGVVREYTQDIAQLVQRQSSIERRLREALTTDSLKFAFQPIISLGSNQVVGFETLARWQDAELGFVSPAEFVPVAERTGLIHQMGMAAASAAIELIRNLDENGIVIYGTFNVSPLQLRSHSFVESLRALVAHHNLSPKRLKVEVTENIFMDADDPALAAVEKLSEIGFPIALDDFGAGYSSLGYVGRIPCDVIKLDRTVTINLGDETIKSIVQALVAASANGDVTVVPEGVETEDNAAELRELGVSVAQGWLWSKAVSGAEFQELVASRGHQRMEFTENQPTPVQS